MSEQDRIRLAEAMGWLFPEGQQCVGVPPNDLREPGRGNITEIPNPFTDANADYAVLEWMRKTVDDWSVIEDALIDVGVSDCIDYHVGHYARAALKVLDDD